ncbi:hypothetical protein M2444_005601 [Paenibacillus sp. PastF-3]|uniref:hypothetical protein n=1 Tax=unclassified Paenibacillus TaxID=185978 RepID=UPI002476AA4E|nr:hypothetical protein [Paenibacillus sp. PastF-3]MDH6373758.1 hypothetical protein [Paenibacillus sp. PastF-3]
MAKLPRIFFKKDKDMVKNSNLIIGPSGSGRTYNWVIEREELKSFANSLLNAGDVYYVDLTEKPNKFLGLNPKCHTYQDIPDFNAILEIIKSLYDDRIKLYDEGASCEGLPFINLIVYEKNQLPEKSLHNLQALMDYTLEKQRIAKLVFVLHDSVCSTTY